MARNYILGGMAATQLQAGKPFFKRVVRINGNVGGTDGVGGIPRALTDPEGPGILVKSQPLVISISVAMLVSQKLGMLEQQARTENCLW